MLFSYLPFKKVDGKGFGKQKLCIVIHDYESVVIISTNFNLTSSFVRKR